MPADYRIWGRIEEVGPGQFLAIACAVRDDSTQPTSTRVLNQVLPTRQEAEACLRDLVRSLGQSIISKGSRVTDVETDGI